MRYLDILKVHVNGPLPRGGSKPEYPEKNPDNQSENRYHISSPPQPGIEPSPSNIGDHFLVRTRRFQPVEQLAAAVLPYILLGMFPCETRVPFPEESQLR